MEEEHRNQHQTAEEEENQFEPNEIEKLQEKGINVSDINKLKNAGFCTVLSVIMATKRQFLNIKGISEAKMEKIKTAAMEIENAGFVTGNDVLNKRKQLIKISTGSKNLDQLLGGGLESMSITEVYGEYRTGKTQLCMTIAVTAQLPRSMGGGGGKVLYVDAEGTFRPERIAKIAQRFGVEAEEVLGNIIYARAYTTEHQNTLLVMAAAHMMEEVFSLVIVDSIMALYRVDYSGRGQLSERQQNLGQFLSKLMKIAEQFNVAVLLTNQVMADPGGGMGSFMGDTRKPIGGHVLAHAATTRLYFKKGKGEQRVCKVMDSPNLPESSCVFQLSDDGLVDPCD